ncbi:ImmA/IrrE family metallo-endopeptidase [Ferrimicrobium sp.]|uniref:ImmA/IrrE family metallo-endopeptidase n=1 Tax=Ferrimicrobium sp. TaxID=2926050 RepID=UPI00260432A1|nr:ImmA/IrrE family metallo-endopeptidase [Ferrimicrobium sp.]
MATDHHVLLDKLTDGIIGLANSERWHHYLSAQARFHDYSPRNALLIALQCPHATQVAGFHAWRALGRSVNRGQKAIYIVAPLIGRDQDGETEVTGFRWVPVFDISQTEGDELPEACETLVGDDPESLFAQLIGVARVYGFAVSIDTLPQGVNGLCRHRAHEILISPANAPTHQVKTLAHELAHAILHEGETDRALAELEAESAAFVVCQALGIDSRDYSFGYVATWAGGTEAALANIERSAGRIQRCTKAILQRLGNAASELANGDRVLVSQ